MGTELSNRRRRAAERREALGQVAILDVTRHLTRAGADEVDRVAAWAHVAEQAAAEADRWARAAVAGGATYAEVADALGMTRQGARKRYGNLQVVGG